MCSPRAAAAGSGAGTRTPGRLLRTREVAGWRGKRHRAALPFATPGPGDFHFGCAAGGLKPFANVVTELQLTQFVTMMAQAIAILAFGCAYPNRVVAFYLCYIFVLFALFRAFYAVKHVAPKEKDAMKIEAAPAAPVAPAATADEAPQAAARKAAAVSNRSPAGAL